MRRGHVPVRRCVVCGAKKPKGDLLRLSLNSEKRVILDFRQCMQGRGAYVCPVCLPQLRFNKRVQRAFRDRAKGLAQDILRESSHRANRENRFDSGRTEEAEIK